MLELFVCFNNTLYPIFITTSKISNVLLVQWTGKNPNGSTYPFQRQDSAKIAEWLSVDAFSATLCYTEHVVTARAIVSRVGIALACSTHVHPRLQSRSLVRKRVRSELVRKFKLEMMQLEVSASFKFSVARFTLFSCFFFKTNKKIKEINLKNDV